MAGCEAATHDDGVSAAVVAASSVDTYTCLTLGHSSASVAQQVMIAVTVFLGLIVTGTTCASLILILAVSVGPRCPACGGDALLVQRSWLLRRLIPWLEQRWCMSCGWGGITRRGRPHVAARRNHQRAAQPELGEN